jgi:predicted oxidoreductase (fatty acid repression mutant protein)
MANLTVLLSPSFGSFSPNRSFAKLLKQKGYAEWNSIEARTDKDIVEFVKAHMEKTPNDFNVAFIGVSKDQYVILHNVDTAKPWAIIQQHGAEAVQYVAYNVLNSKLNLCQLTE